MLDMGKWGWWRFRGTWGFLYTWNKIEFHKFKDTLKMEIVWRLPLWVINWAVVRAASTALDTYSVSPSDLTYRQMFNATYPQRKQLGESDEYESTEPGDGDPVGGEPAEV